MTETISQRVRDQTPDKELASSTVAGGGDTQQLLARARYNNVAESPDELSFRLGDVVTVVKKDFNKQVDWWLCELRGKVGMVPANYFEIFYNHDSSSEYDIPKPSKNVLLSSSSSSSSEHPAVATQSSVPLPSNTQSAVPLPSLTFGRRPLSSSDATDGPIYDFPPVVDTEGMDRDYDLPPAEITANAGFETYDRPPSSNRGTSSPIGSTRSSMKSMNRMSTASSVSSSTGIYDIPPDLMDVYDFPKSSRVFEEEERQANILQAVDISSLMDDEAEDMLRSYCQVITATYDALFSTVYGPEAYWGTDHKAKRVATLKMSMTAARHFDKAVLILLQFGKGVVNRLEYISDANFKKKYLNAFKGLLHSRNDILGKLEALNYEAESVTGTVKSLLEIARTVPRAVTEFTVLLQANKSILFKTSNKSSGNNLPVITKNEVKTRPLPELPHPSLTASTEGQDGDYAIPVEGEEMLLNSPHKLNGESNLDYNAQNKRRKPNDTLPPLPYATMPRSSGGGVVVGGGGGGGGKTSPAQRSKATPDPKSPVHGGLHSPYSSKSSVQPSPSPSRQQRIEVIGGDYDEIDKKTRERSVVLSSRPSLASLDSSRGPSPTNTRSIRRQGSLSSCSSSDDLSNSTGMRRANSVELLDSPYGCRPNGCHHQRQLSSPQPLKMEEKMILDRFAKQFDLIIPGLRDAIDLLLNCLRENEPPKDFVTKSKHTVVAAYKLVYVADALSQKIVHTETKMSITTASNDLTESIKDLVSATKTAALQYPSVIALDKMGGGLKQVYPCALDLINSVKTRAN